MKRWKRWKRWAIAAIVLLLLLLFMFFPSGPLITISKETTYITEPLRPDGTVDYVAALNQHYGEGVTPENNAAVLFWQAAGPKAIPPELREAFFKKLGIAPLPEAGDYYVDRYVFAGVDFKVRWPQFGEAMDRPWSKEEFPIVAQWIECNEKPMELVIEGCSRPRCYDPLVPDDVLVKLDPFPHCYQHRNFMQFLIARAMLRLKEDKIDEAWADLLAIRRLARLVSQGPGSIDVLVALNCDEVAFFGERFLLSHGSLTAEKIAAMRADLDQLPPMAKWPEKLDMFERFMLLDMISVYARTGTVPMKAFQPDPVLRFVSHKRIGWSWILRTTNSYIDRWIDALKKPTRAERVEAIRRIDEDLCQMGTRLADWKTFTLSAIANPRKTFSERIGYGFFAVQTPAENAEDRYAMRFELTKLAFALAAYRAANGTYPERLADLVPKYVAEVPKDIFNDADLHYEHTDNGYVLYSVGLNGTDDGGRTEYDSSAPVTAPDGDDLTVRIPVPQPKTTGQTNEPATKAD
jgi:hypothetical protein